MDSGKLPYAVESSLNNAIAAACDQFIPYRSRLKLKGTLIIDGGRGENKVSVRLNKDLIKHNKLSKYKINDLTKYYGSQDTNRIRNDQVNDFHKKQNSHVKKSSLQKHSLSQKGNMHNSNKRRVQDRHDPVQTYLPKKRRYDDSLSETSTQVKRKQSKSQTPSDYLQNKDKNNKSFLREKVNEISETMETIFLPEGVELRYCMCGSCGGVVLDLISQDNDKKTKENPTRNIASHLEANFNKSVENVTTLDTSHHVTTQVAPHHVKTQVAPHHVKTQVAPQHVTTQVAPQKVTTQVTPQHVTTQVAPQHVKTQVAPHSVTTQVAPQHVTPQVAPQHVTPQVAQQYVKTQVAPQHVKTQVAPQHVKTQVAPQHVVKSKTGCKNDLNKGRTVTRQTEPGPCTVSSDQFALVKTAGCRTPLADVQLESLADKDTQNATDGSKNYENTQVESCEKTTGTLDVRCEKQNVILPEKCEKEQVILTCRTKIVKDAHLNDNILHSDKEDDMDVKLGEIIDAGDNVSNDDERSGKTTGSADDVLTEKDSSNHTSDNDFCKLKVSIIISGRTFICNDKELQILLIITFELVP